MKRWALIVILGLTAPTPRLAAQEPFPDEPSVGIPIVAGALLGGTGMVVGAVVGYPLDTSCDNTSDFCLPVWGVFLGSGVLGTIGLATGTHLGNRLRGSYARVLGTSGLIWGAGFGLAYAARNTEGASALVLLALPIIQFAATVATERSTGRNNEAAYRERQRVSTFATPDASGRFRFGLRVTW